MRTDKARPNQAQSVASTICTGIHYFQNDYDVLPHPASRVAGFDCDTDTSEQEQLILILKGFNETQNPRSQDYLGEIKDAKMLKGGPVGGIVRNNGSIALYDPWGSHYLIRLDGNYDGFVTDPEHPPALIKAPVIVWSAGKDRDPATWADNIRSWIP